MRSRRGTLSRREFLHRALGGSAVALGAGLWPRRAWGQLPPEGPSAPGPVEERSPVIRVTSPEVMDPYGRVDRERMFRMIDRAMMGITGKFRLKDMVANYVGPEDRVGLLVNRAWGLGTKADLVELIYLWVVYADVPEENILTWNGQARGYNRDGLARNFVEWATVIFSLPSLYTHWRLGMVGALANILGLVPDPDPYYRTGGRDIGKLWSSPSFRRKHKLVIMDALWPYFGSGPSFDPELRWLQQALLVSEDPVAVDVVAKRMLLERRQLHRGRDWPLEPPADYIERADTIYRLGHSNPKDILLRDVWVRRGEE